MKEHKACDCGREVPFPLWYHQRKKRLKPMCPLCVARKALDKLRGW